MSQLGQAVWEGSRSQALAGLCWFPEAGLFFSGFSVPLKGLSLLLRTLPDQTLYLPRPPSCHRPPALCPTSREPSSTALVTPQISPSPWTVSYMGHSPVTTKMCFLNEWVNE